jgi:hypothetical protein
VTDESTLPVRAEPLNSYRLASLAQQVAVNLRPLSAIIADYGISEEDYKQILTWPFYKTALEAAILDWNSPMSAEKRMRLEAAMIVENNMPHVAARMTDSNETLTAVVEAGKWFIKIAGIGEPNKNPTAGEKFSITINLGEDKKLTFEKDVTPNQPLLEQKVEPNEPS